MKINLAIPCCLVWLASPLYAATNAFEVAATTFDRGNVKIFAPGGQWADSVPMVAFGGSSPIIAEFDIEFPVSAEYTISFEYSAGAARPVELSVGGKDLGQACRAVTGGWKTSQAKWERACALALEKGKHTVRLEREGAFPHLVALRFESSVPLPEGWKPVRKEAAAAAKPAAPAAPQTKPWLPVVNTTALRLAVTDLTTTFGARYPRGQEFLARLEALEKAQAGAKAEAVASLQAEFQALQREALLANPLLDFKRLLFVKRHQKSPQLGLPANWQSNSSLPLSGYDDTLSLLSLDRLEAEETVLFKPDGGRFIGDVDLHFDGDKLLFSMPGTNRHWQVFELADLHRRLESPTTLTLRQLTGEQPDVHSYDACYLPDDRIIFSSTACFAGVPCVYGSSHVANLYLMDSEGKNIRQLCFDQEHDWCPTVLNNGRILYTRWEYTDTPHSNTRLLFHMNPDGTGQMELLGSNSYWPNSFFYARPIPGHPTKIISVISGHHGDRRMGELVLFDPAKGRFEAEGAVQRIPGHGKKVEMVFRDQLTAGLWPKFLHPWPLSEKYFLVSCQPEKAAPWGLYLVDVFDNMLPLKQLPEYALFEPIPFRAVPRPPVIPDKVNLKTTNTMVFIQDIYSGDGLKGLPRGTVKQLRVFTYHFAYQGMGGLLGVLGLEGPWDIRRVLGTVPVHEDGSAKFLVPANTPISVQPLDEEGKALQLMRSWMTGMPGETLQCAGCHERQNTAPPRYSSMALSRPPDALVPWHGPVRGFSYPREVQPVIDRYCVGCHDGQPDPAGRHKPDLRGAIPLKDWKSVTPGQGGAHGGKFSVGYAELQRYVRRPGIESDYHLLEPMEFHADSTDLVQMLKRGHHQVKLDAEAWDRLITWIDLNCPYHGTWSEELDRPGRQAERRRELLQLYGGIDQAPEIPPVEFAGPVQFIRPPAPPPAPPLPECPGWPFDAAEAQRRQAAAGAVVRKTVDLGDGLGLELALIPAGEFRMGSLDGESDERPVARVRLANSFWMATREVDNRLFAKFDPAHDSRVEDKNTYQFGVHGYPANRPEQPVVRVTWHQAMAFCQWLSARTGQRFTLPTEAQWEYACRAGSAGPFHYGDLNADFSLHANLADAKLREFASDPYTVDVPLKNPTKYDDWIPKDSRFNDGALITVAPGRYLPNPWGLFDMHGNAAEWTRTSYAPQPGNPDADRETARPGDRMVVRGGSWRDVPRRATASFRLCYHPYQKVYNVGFRVVCETPPGTAGLSSR